MDKKNKIFFAVFFTLIAGVVIVTFMKYFVAKDYYISAQADCDPYTQKCFIWNCDPNSTVEGEKCTGEAETDTWYYQKVRKIANEIPNCDPNDENCDALVCSPGMDCELTYCDEATKPEGEQCSDPVKYTEENPIEEEGDSEEVEECAPDDEECVNAQDSGESEDPNEGESDGQNLDDNANDSSSTDINKTV
jgi:hypothetical protein